MREGDCEFRSSTDYRVKPVSKKKVIARWWWCTPLISTLGRQRQVDLNEFEASLVYKS